MLPCHLSPACAECGGTSQSQGSTSQSWAGSQAQQQLAVGGEMSSAGEQLSVGSRCSGGSKAERARSPCPDERDPQARQDTGTPPGQAGHTGQAKARWVAQAAPRLPPGPGAHAMPRAGTGQGVPALQPPLGRGQLRSQSSCCARARGAVGNYGTAVKYKLGKNHCWRQSSVGVSLGVPLLPADRSSHPDLLLGCLLFLYS